MPSLRASATTRWRLAAIGAVLVGTMLPWPELGGSAAQAMPLWSGPSCGAPEGLPALLRPGLVRADKPRRPPAAAPVAPGIAAEAEPLEAPAVPMHAFFTCFGAVPRPQAVVQGFRVTGPVRRS